MLSNLSPPEASSRQGIWPASALRSRIYRPSICDLMGYVKCWRKEQMTHGVSPHPAPYFPQSLLKQDNRMVFSLVLGLQLYSSSVPASNLHAHLHLPRADCFLTHFLCHVSEQACSTFSPGGGLKQPVAGKLRKRMQPICTSKNCILCHRL